MNQIHEDDWGEESWSRHSGMFDPESWQDDEEIICEKSGIALDILKIIEISKENGYSAEMIAEITGLSIQQIESLHA